MNYSLKEIDVTPPSKRAIANILKDGLKEHFKEVSVEWVDCPDLRKKPFNLAAPGLCGKPALMQVGGLANVYPWQQIHKTYNIKHLLTEFGYNEKTLVIGAGMCKNPLTTLNCELYMNTLYSPKNGRMISVFNRSRTLFYLSKTCRTGPYKIHNNLHECSMYGNFFISGGKPGQVIKVYAKKRIGSLDFISAMQSSSCYGRTSKYMIDLGGTFVVNNGKVWHHLMPHRAATILRDFRSIHQWLRYRCMPTPFTAVGTFSNRIRHHLGNASSGFEVLNITKQHFHTFSSIYNTGGHYYIDALEKDVATEYLGYFCPAKKFYCVDPVNVNIQIPECNLDRFKKRLRN
ncbi:ester hydrolase C11orf54 homolog [Linepithema humile]|uniref:ester hydrolase C11orf54 homolog n=1 Tax=Linepithema humile TaxID=83485 RepID=UPI00351E5313